MARKRKNHRQFLLNREKVPIDRVFPGMIIEFQYRSKTGMIGQDAGDPRPMFFVLAKERQKRLLHGVNLNYLPQHIVQRMFTLISRKIPVNYVEAGSGYNFIRGAYTKVDIPLGNKIIPRNLYEQVIKPKILDISPDFQAYRTYKISKIGTAYVLNYKLNIHLDRIKDALEAQLESVKEQTQDVLEKQNQENSRKLEKDRKEFEKRAKELQKMIRKSARKLPKSSTKKMMAAAAAKNFTKKGMDKKIDKKAQKRSTKPIKKKVVKKPTASKPKKTVKKVKTIKPKRTKKK